VSTDALLEELASRGIHLEREGRSIFAEVEAGADVTPHTDRIKRNKPALLAELHLREQIVAAASAAQDAFDRQHYDALWKRWHALQEQETS
jgi:hypothetical protein